MSGFRGPEFELVPETTSISADGLRNVRSPLLIRGALKNWPAWTRWSFDQIAARCDEKKVVSRFQEGLVEQGSTNPLPVLPVAPYLRELSAATKIPPSDEAGLFPPIRRRALRTGERFTLDWRYLQSLPRDRRYLADWALLEAFPELRHDLNLAALWPGWRWTWEYSFIGPAHTVTGLHQDIHNNWLCQVRGTKEILLFAPDETPRLHVSRKYNLGSVLSQINISKIQERPEHAADLEKTRGLYARVEAGDALFIPKFNWHAVVALEPSITLAAFGLTAGEIVTAGAWAEFKNVLHLCRLYRWRNCVCHQAAPGIGMD